MLLELGWTWMARMVNLPPRAISPALVVTFLELAGTAMLAAYDEQFRKLLRALANRWLPMVPTDEPLAVASKSRLGSYLEDYQRTGCLGEVEGRVIAPS
ncbi:hypothetical protein EC988_004679 [Linderina pennispora]|nr:hypothetical protein EC988_004679 [Linderina pennispora]